MDKKALVEKILGLTRAQKEFFVDNFDRIESVLAKEAQKISFIKKAQEEGDFSGQLIQILLSGLKNDPQSMQVVQSFVQSGQEPNEEIGSVLRNVFSNAYDTAGMEAEYKDFYLSSFDDLLSNTSYFIGTLKGVLPSPSPENLSPPEQEVEEDETPTGEPAPEEEAFEETRRPFAEVFGVNESEVEYIDSKYGTRHAVYRGVMNIPVDKENNVLLTDDDVAFFKEAIDDGYIGFFKQEAEEDPVKPDEIKQYDPGEEGLDTRVRKLKSATDPLTIRYKKFFDMKSDRVNEAARLEMITNGYENRIIAVYNELTGSNEVSYVTMIEKYKEGKMPKNFFNDLKNITASIRKRVFGLPLSARDKETLGSHVNRTPEDEELYRRTMGLRAIDDLSNDYIGKMQKLYIGEKIGQETHDRVMELGELVYGTSVQFDGPTVKNGASLKELVMGTTNVSELVIPRSILPQYMGKESVGVPDDAVPENILNAYRNNVSAKIGEIKAAFAANGIENPETIENYLDSLYSPESYSYYKHTAETTRYYQIQNELSRLGSFGNKSSNSFWCSRCGRFRPQPREGNNRYIDYKDGNGNIRRTYNIPPSADSNRMKDMQAAGVEIVGTLMSGVRADDPVTEYEKTLLSPEALEIVNRRCENAHFSECDFSNNFFPNLISTKKKTDANSLEFMGMLPLRLFGQEVTKIDPEEIGEFSQSSNVSSDRKAYFPANYEEIITNLSEKIFQSFGDQADSNDLDEIRRDLLNTVRLVASDTEIMSEAKIKEDPEHPANEYYDSASSVLDYLNFMVRKDPEKSAEVQALMAQIRSAQHGDWVTEESLYNLEALREWVSLFGFDSYSKTSLKRLNANVNVPETEGRLREEAGIEDVGIHSLLYNDNITDVPINDIALMSSKKFIESNEDAQSLIRKLVLSRFRPELDTSEIGRMYPDSERENTVVERNDAELLDFIFEQLKAQPIRIPKPHVIFKEVYNQDYASKGKKTKPNKHELEKDIKERYRKYLYEFELKNYEDPDYANRKVADMDLYLYNVPLDMVAPYVYELVHEYRKLNRGRRTFMEPLSGLDPSIWSTKANPSNRRQVHATKLAMPWVSWNEDPRDVMETIPGEPVPNYSNIAWFGKKYQEAAASNPTPESVAQAYAAAGIEGKEITNPVLDLALLNATNLENTRIRFEKDIEDKGLKKELEIELMRQSLREECRYIYLDTHTGGGPEKAKGIGSFDDDVTMIMIAAAIEGKDPTKFTAAKSPEYDSMRESPVYGIVKELITSSKDTMENKIVRMAGGEVPVQFEPAFSPEMSIQDKLQYREQHRRYKGLGSTKTGDPEKDEANIPHLTSMHDSLIKYLISPKKIAHNILLDLSSTGAYLEEANRIIVSRLLVGAMQGPDAQSMFADRPYATTVAYHVKNAATGFFEPAQMGDSFFAHSTSGSPAFIDTLLGDREANWIGGTNVYEVMKASGGRRTYNPAWKDQRSQQMSSSKRKLKKLMQEQFEAQRKASVKKWYKKAQTKPSESGAKKLGLDEFLFFSDRDLMTAVRNIGYRLGGNAPIRATLPKLFLRPFSDFKSISAVKAYAKKTGLNAVPVTSEARELIDKMGLRLG